MDNDSLWASLSEAVLQPEALEPALERWSAQVGADGFIWNDVPGATDSALGFTRLTSAAFRDARFMPFEEALHHDPRVARVQASPNRVMVASRELGAHFGQDEMHRRILVGQLGTPFTMGCLARAPGALRASAMLALHRTRRSGDFGAAQITALERALPALHQFLHVRQHCAQLARQVRQGEAALAALPEAVLALLPGRRILWANALAEQLLARASPVIRKGGLLDGAPGAQRALQAAVSAAEQQAIATEALLHDAAGQPWLLCVAPTHSHGAFSPQPWARAVLLVRCAPLAGVSAAPSPARLQALFGLTRAEAALAASLAGGLSLAAHAAAVGVRMTTVRYHVRAVLEKTGSRDLQALCLQLGRLGSR